MLHVPQFPLWDNRLAKPAKLGYYDIAVCETIRGLTNVPGPIRHRAIVEMIEVANDPVLSQVVHFRRRDPTILRAVGWSKMPSGPDFWASLHKAARSMGTA